MKEDLSFESYLLPTVFTTPNSQNSECLIWHWTMEPLFSLDMCHDRNKSDPLKYQEMFLFFIFITIKRCLVELQV